MEVVGKLGQLPELDLIVREVLFILHVVNVGVLDVLRNRETYPYEYSFSTSYAYDMT